jgi:DNA-binding transcriptional regulator YiaG
VLTSSFGKCLECEDPAEGRDGLCRSCRGFLSAKRNFAKRNQPAYVWDVAKEARLKRCYDFSDRKELSCALARLANELKYPKVALRRRAEQLGLTMWKHVRWTAEEIAILEEHAGNKTVGWICRQLKKKTGIGRSYNSVKCKAEEIGRSVRLRDGYAKKDLAELFGTTEFTVNKWFEKGWFMPDGNARVSDGKVLKFLREHPSEWHFRRVDEAWVKGILFPTFGAEYTEASRREI